METCLRQRATRKSCRSCPAFESGHRCAVSGQCDERSVTLISCLQSADKLIITKSFPVSLKSSSKIHLFPKPASAFNVSVDNSYCFPFVFQCLPSDDCKKLYKDWRIHVRHCLDLSLLARCVDNARWKGKYTQPIGLSHLLEVYKKFSLPKGKIRQSNWENELNDRQQDCTRSLYIISQLIECPCVQMQQTTLTQASSSINTF